MYSMEQNNQMTKKERLTKEINFANMGAGAYLCDCLWDIMEDHEDDLEDMTKVELKEIVMEAVALSPAEKPKVLQHVDEDDVGKMTKETLQKVAEEVIKNKLESIEEMTKQELKEIVMEVAVEKEELIIVPVAEEDIEQMNLKELKEFVKEASDLAAVEKPNEEVTEEDVAKVGFNNIF